jgi:hypothetical protein
MEQYAIGEESRRFDAEESGLSAKTALGLAWIVNGQVMERSLVK